MSSYDALSPKRRAFVDAYVLTGNASEAARKAGYTTKANVQGARLLAIANIRAAIAERAKPKESARIAEAQEVLEKLTAIMRDGSLEPKDQLKAAELLGKRYALWVERIEMEHKGGLGVLMLPPKKRVA